MEKNGTISNIYLMLGLLGEILVLVGFFILTPNGRSNVAWLNWAVISFIFGLIYYSSDILFPPTEGFSGRIPAIGIRFIVCLFYSLLAIIWIYFSYRWQLVFRVQLLGHLVMGFAVIVGYTIAAKSSEYAAKIEDSEKSQESVLISAKKELNLICTVFAKGLIKDSPQYKLQAYSEELRFISPVNNDQVRELEVKILELIQQIKSLLPSELYNIGDSNEESLNRDVESLGLMIKQRKAFRM